jgi:hypothetical protein
MNSKSWICVQVACYAYASSTPLCLGCSILFRGGHNTRQETKKLPTLVVGFWSNEKLAKFLSTTRLGGKILLACFRNYVTFPLVNTAPKKKKKKKKLKP